MAKILGTGHALPAQRVTNEDLKKWMDTSDEWIRQRSGISERRWSRQGNSANGGPSNTDLAEQASRLALKNAKLNAQDIDAIVFATITPDNEMPGSGVILHQRLCPDKKLHILEVRNHCTGFLYALCAAQAYIESGLYSRVLVIGAELQSTGLQLDTAGRGTAVLFGDGAGAVVLGPGDGIIAQEFASDGNYAAALGIEAPCFARPHAYALSDFEGDAPAVSPRMEGPLVFKMASQAMPQMVRQVLAKAGFAIEDVKLIVPHQANQRILDMLGKDLGCPEKVFSNIALYGNTTAGTIPIALSECVEAGKIKAGDLVCLVSFGAGFAWGAILLRY
jgi:3-oxoacyl-[acyl-carrier-protein] synthase-3